MKTLIVYYSMSGNCELVAGKLAEALAADVLRIEPEKAYPDSGAKKFLWGGKSAVMGEKPVLKPYEFAAEAYDTVILGFPVWASNPAPPVKTFAAAHAEALRTKRLAAFACFSGGGASKALLRLKKLIGIETLAAELILVDPKTKADPANEALISDFCDKLK